MPHIHSAIGNIIRAHREKRGLTQLEVARKLGHSSAQFVSLMEKGKSKVPLETLGQFVVILGINEKEILSILLNNYRSTLVKELNIGKSQHSRSK